MKINIPHLILSTSVFYLFLSFWIVFIGFFEGRFCKEEPLKLGRVFPTYYLGCYLRQRVELK